MAGEKTKGDFDIIIEVRGGVAHVVKKAGGISLLIVDYDARYDEVYWEEHDVNLMYEPEIEVEPNGKQKSSN